MYWRFDMKIREQFIVSAFSLTVWQTYLHILINVYWNEYGLIQTDATNGIVVYSFLAWLITESVYNDAFRTFTSSMQQCIVYMTNNIKIILINFRFQIGNDRQSKRLLCKLGENSSFSLSLKKILIKTGIRDFLLDIYSAYKSFVWTAALGLEFSWIQWYRFDFAFILVI